MKHQNTIAPMSAGRVTHCLPAGWASRFARHLCLLSAWTVPMLAMYPAQGQQADSPSARPTTAEDIDRQSAWYFFDWMADARFAPVFRVRDTESSLGPYARQLKAITLKDLVKMHGHPCDGLITAACAMSVGLDRLFPDGVIDRTDLCCVTNNSPCFGDVASYLTGARIRFGTQKIDPTLGNEFILWRQSTGRAVKVSLKDGIFPQQLAALEARVRAGTFTDDEMRRCQQLGWDFARQLLDRPLGQSFETGMLDDYQWQPDAYPHAGKRGDVIHKQWQPEGRHRKKDNEKLK